MEIISELNFVVLITGGFTFVASSFSFVGLYFQYNLSTGFVYNARLRLYDIFVFHDGHPVRLGSKRSINSCHVLVGSTTTSLTSHCSCPCMVSSRMLGFLSGCSGRSQRSHCCCLIMSHYNTHSSVMMFVFGPGAEHFFMPRQNQAEFM